MTEKIINFVFIYIIAWWLVLFCVLPFGLEVDSKNGKEVLGVDKAAPETPKLKKKFIITSIIAFVVVVIWNVVNDIYQII